jgi:hypothetical protein
VGGAAHISIDYWLISPVCFSKGLDNKGVVNTPPPKERWLLGVGRLKSRLRLTPLGTCSSRLKARARLLAEHPRSRAPLTGSILLKKNLLTENPRSVCPLSGTTPPRNTRPDRSDSMGISWRFGPLFLSYGSSISATTRKPRCSSFPRFTVVPWAKAAA